MGNALSTVFHPFTNTYGICNIILHVSCIAFFIAIFFFTYGSFAEGRIVQKQCENIVESLTGGLNGILTSEQLCDLRRHLQTTTSHFHVTEGDKRACRQNRQIKSKALKTVGIVLGAAFGVALLCWLITYIPTSSKIVKFFHLPGTRLVDLIIVNILVVVFVAFTEYSFLTFIVTNYRSADPNFVKRELLQSLIDYGNTYKQHTKQHTK